VPPVWLPLKNARLSDAEYETPARCPAGLFTADKT
jgi:hypothetical protein